MEEGRGTHGKPEVGWRVEVGWPYYFLQRRSVADAEWEWEWEWDGTFFVSNIFVSLSTFV